MTAATAPLAPVVRACKVCGQVKPPDQFRTDHVRWRRRTCKPCENTRPRSAWRDTPDTIERADAALWRYWRRPKVVA